jgi:hypothetical protein
MAAPSSVVSLDLLPTELKANIFAFIRTSEDRGAVCLVNSEGRAFMNSTLWKRLVSTFERSTRNLTSLLQPDSGILPHTRELYIIDSRVEFVRGGRRQELLKAVIGALPRDLLTDLTYREDICQSAVMHLLQSQRQLKALDVETQTAGGRKVPQLPSICAAP